MQPIPEIPRKRTGRSAARHDFHGRWNQRVGALRDARPRPRPRSVAALVRRLRGGLRAAAHEPLQPDSRADVPRVRGLGTDGLIEAAAPEGDESFCDEELPRALARGAGLRADAFADTLLERVTKWAGSRGGSLADDVMFAVVDYELRVGSEHQ